MEGKIVKSYTKIFRIERRFHGFGGVPLPISLSFNMLIYWGLLALSLHYIGGWMPMSLRYFIIPGAIAWLFDQKLLDGKNPFQFARSILVHYYIVLAKGSKVNRFKYYKRVKPIMHVGITYRVHTPKEKP